jgi:DNA-binding response OmpR family regulator
MTTRARRVLVVEDEPAIADQVAARLRAEGFLVDVAQDGPSAVAQAAEAEPDLVVLDVMLPGFDGLEVCRRLHARRPVPVLMLTARRRDRRAGGPRCRGRRLPDEALLHP